MARANLTLGKPGLAQVSAQDAVAFWERYDPQGRDRGITLVWLARALAAGGHMAQAHDALHQARRILDATSFPEDQALLAQTQQEIPALPPTQP
jgi:hypothetical protein